MIVYRLSKSKYANDLTGLGAERSGGRWNSKGVAIIYTGQSRALCTAEIAVHTPLGNLPLNYQLITLEVPESTFTEISIDDLPLDWKSFPHADSTQKIGDAFIKKGAFLVFKVPSVVVQGDYNYLINPRHPHIDQVKVHSIEDFEFDQRLFGVQ